MVVTYSSQVKKRQDKSNICFVHTCYPRRNLCKICDYFCWAWTISKTSCTLMTTKKANLRKFFLFFFKYKISRSVNNKAMVHQNTIFKNYFSICWGFFFFRKMRIYRIQHAFILAVKELTFSVNCWMQITSFVLLRRTLFGCNEEKKTHLRERKFLTPLLSRRPLLFQSNINFKVIVHAVMGKQRGIVTLCYYIEPSQYGSMNYSSNGQIIYIV